MKLERSLLGHPVVGGALCLGLAFTANAFAESPSSKADVAKLCPQVQPGGGRIAQCLKQNEAHLSAGCQERIKQVAAQLKAVKQACADDLQQYCTGVKPGGGRIAQCLKMHKDQLSSECKTQIADMLEKKS